MGMKQALECEQGAHTCRAQPPKGNGVLPQNLGMGQPRGCPRTAHPGSHSLPAHFPLRRGDAALRKSLHHVYRAPNSGCWGREMSLAWELCS